MKKVVLGLLFVGLLVPLAGFAESPVVSSCVKGDLFDRYTGKPCLSTNTTVPGCLAGYKFSSMTGEKCSSVSVPQSCYVFNRNLTIGMSGEDVSKLEQVVIREGFGKAVGGGIFDDALAASVVQLQGKYGILQTGYFGPLTRAKVNSLGCKVVSVDGPILKSAYIDGSKLVLKGSGFGNAPQVRLSGKAYDKTINTSSDGSSITVTIPSDADSDANPYYVWVVSNAYKGGLDTNTVKVSLLSVQEVGLKARDAGIKSDLAGSRVAAEIYYDKDRTYGPSTSSCSAAMFGTSEFTDYLSGIKKSGGTELTCVSKVDSYAVSVKLNEGYYWCVGSDGFNGRDARAKVVGSDAKCVVN